eukprot:scaffold39082_cov66-Phaeocystis_antarctica.AAC.5
MSLLRQKLLGQQRRAADALRALGDDTVGAVQPEARARELAEVERVERGLGERGGAHLREAPAAVLVLGLVGAAREVVLLGVAGRPRREPEDDRGLVGVEQARRAEALTEDDLLRSRAPRPVRQGRVLHQAAEVPEDTWLGVGLELGLGLGLGLGFVKGLGRAMSAHVVLQHVRHAQERGAEGVGVLRRRPAVGEYDDAQPLVLRLDGGHQVVQADEGFVRQLLPPAEHRALALGVLHNPPGAQQLDGAAAERRLERLAAQLAPQVLLPLRLRLEGALPRDVHMCVRARACVCVCVCVCDRLDACVRGARPRVRRRCVRHTVILPLAVTESNLARSSLLCRGLLPGLLPDGRFSSEGGPGKAGVLLDLCPERRLPSGGDAAAGGAPGAAALGGGGAADCRVCGAPPAAWPKCTFAPGTRLVD